MKKDQLATQSQRVSKISESQKDLIRSQICKDASDDELKLFFTVCERTGLDPLSNQIHAVKRWDSSAGKMSLQIQTGIDGLRLIADRTGERNGEDGPFWCGDDGQWHDVWVSENAPLAAKLGAYRAGSDKPYWGVCRFSEFVQTKKDGSPTKFWKTMPSRMLEKCAEATALRKAFPNELSGIYIPEEMPQSEKEDLEHSNLKTQEIGASERYVATNPQKKLLLTILEELEIKDIAQMAQISEKLKLEAVPCEREAIKDFIHVNFNG